jgi:hypothetical protein
VRRSLRFFALAAIVVAGVAYAHDAPAETGGARLNIEIDTTAWTQTSLIRWPGGSRHAEFFSGPQVLDIPCSTKPIVIPKEPPNPRVRFGLLCGEPTIIFSGLDTVGIHESEDVLFVAHHEAFHLLVESMGSRMRVAAHQRGVETEAIREFWELLRSSVESHDPAEAQVSRCQAINSQFSSLSTAERSHIDGISHVEWPADAYAGAAIFGAVRSRPLDSFRAKLGPPIGYAYSGIMMQKIEGHFSRAEWQRRYVNGVPVINMLMESLGCGQLVETGMTMRPNGFSDLSSLSDTQ